MSQPAGRTLDAGLRLLDRQILDADGAMAGKVDDLELELPDHEGALPVVVAIISGPGALGRALLGRRLGAWLESFHTRLHPDEQDGPARFTFGVVKRVDDHVEISLTHEQLPSHRFERWARDHVIAHIPGATHEAE